MLATYRLNSVMNHEVATVFNSSVLNINNNQQLQIPNSKNAIHNVRVFDKTFCLVPNWLKSHMTTTTGNNDEPII